MDPLVTYFAGLGGSVMLALLSDRTTPGVGSALVVASVVLFAGNVLWFCWRAFTS
jgi:hypothetical protein